MNIELTGKEKNERDNAYNNLEKLREFIERFNSHLPLSCAVLNQCSQDISNNEIPETKRQERSNFLANIAEYFFENLWQDDKRQYTQDSYLFIVY